MPHRGRRCLCSSLGATKTGAKKGGMWRETPSKKINNNEKAGGNPRVRSKGLRKGRERGRQAKEKERSGERLPRTRKGGRWGARPCIQQDGALAPVCSTNSASISWGGLEGRKGATSGARTVLKGPEETWGCPGCPWGQREKLGVLGGAGQGLLARLLSVSRLGWDRMTGVSGRN